MPDLNPTNEEYLAVVSEWSSYGQQSASRVGNAYPILCITRGEVVATPMDVFPNPGYIFLVNRGELTAWDYVRIRPVENARYKHANPRECYYIARGTPQVLDIPSTPCNFAVVLDVAGFDPVTAGSQIRNPSQNVTPWFFVRNAQQRIFGPLRRLQLSRTGLETLDGIQWAPWREDSVVYEFSAETLKKQGLKIETYSHPESDLNEVVRRPIHLLIGSVLTAVSEKVYDRLSDAQLAEWYLRWSDVPDVPEALLKAFRTAPDALTETTPEIIRQRCRRLTGLFGTLEVLQNERRAVARRYLDSPDGKKTLDQQLALEMERHEHTIEAEVKKRRSELVGEEQRLAARLQELDNEHNHKKKTLDDELCRLERKHADLRAGLTALEAQTQRGAEQLAAELRENIPLLAVLAPSTRMTGSANNHPPMEGSPPVPDRPLWTNVSPPEPTKDLADVTTEAIFVDQLTAELTAEHLCFTRDFVANLYVTLKSSALNLITGPPGHGKSSIVAALARAMGHGNALLEIAVRRSWSDDRYLLGFYDTFHGRYDPGPTGLATRLLQAQYDWERDRRGLYMILLDEFNLAAPEYYFSQLLQIVTRPGERLLRLFDPASLPPTTADRVHQIRLYPNVSFWGTINYDETTERLSPRLLDRTGMIFLTARDILPSLTAAEAGSRLARRGVKAGQLVQTFARQADQCPEEHWELIEPFLDLLKKQTEEWGPGIDLSPRVIDGIKRYLANSPSLLGTTRAVDFVLQQRVLPVLRGRGPQFSARVKALVEKLTEKGLDRSARHVRDALAQADLNLGDIDFLGY